MKLKWQDRVGNEIVDFKMKFYFLDKKMKLWYNMYSEKYIVNFGGIFYPYL